MPCHGDIDVVSRLKQAAEAKIAADPALAKLLLAGGAGALLGTGIGAGLTHSHDEIARRRAKNTAFGAGVATGLAGPAIVHGLDARLSPQPQWMPPVEVTQ